MEASTKMENSSTWLGQSCKPASNHSLMPKNLGGCLTFLRQDCLESTPEHGGGDASEKLTEITNVRGLERDDGQSLDMLDSSTLSFPK